jgi:regulator of cell morphogenesis and NO signaling
MSLIEIQMRKTPEQLDVREIVPRERHSLIFDAFEQLAPGQSFVLINDHDPKPLYYQFQAEQPGQVRWEYLEQGPEVWRVRIGRQLDLAATPILELITAYPVFKPVLDQFGLDTCCGGHLTVTESAAEEDIDPAPVIEALRAAL